MTPTHPGATSASGGEHPLLISVVISTLNRPHTAPSAIRSVLRQTVAPESIEILVVDNGSATDTVEALARLAGQHASVRLIHEAELGVSAARNRGALEARAPIVAYLDDDAVADPAWAQNLLTAFSEVPAAAAVGGRISLDFAGGPPDWLPETAFSAYGHHDQGPARREVTHLFGSNMAVRKAAFLQAGGFVTHLGRKGVGLVSGEEDELCERIQQAGLGSIIYEPSAHVTHVVGPERLKIGWLLRRTHGAGQTVALWRPPLSHPAASIVKAMGHFAVALGWVALAWVIPRSGRRAVTRATRGAYLWGLGSAPRRST